MIGKNISLNDLVDKDSQRTEVQQMDVYDDDGALLNTFAIVRDVSEIIDGIKQHAVEKNRLDAVKAVLKEYNVHIDNVLHESDIRLITYSPT